MSYDLWSRLRYVLSPQFDIYEQVSKLVRGMVADVGSGTGFGTHLFTRNADQVIGFEVDEIAMEFAKRAFSNGNIDFRKEDIIHLPPSENEQTSFDYVTMIDVIEHIREDETAIKNCKAILKKGGIFICSTPNRLSRYRKSDYHVREYSPLELKALLKSVFETVGLVNYKLEPLASDYENPILAVCQ